ncbi:hypothetical protein ACHAXS_004203 [Conticribra weissflogii]
MKDGAFIVETAAGEVIFKCCPYTSFPFINLDDHSNDNAVMLIQTVKENYKGYTSRNVENAISARRAQGMIGNPSKKDFKKMLADKDKVSNSLLRSCPYNPTDATHAHEIFCPSLPRLRGTSTRTKPSRVKPSYVDIPPKIVEPNIFVTLVGDVMFISGAPFLITLSRKIQFVTVQFMPRQTATELGNGLLQVLKLYRRAGFIVQTTLMDNKFESICNKLLDKVIVNTTAKIEHVGEIERKICHVKERCRAIMLTLPYRNNPIPTKIIKGLVNHVVMWLNSIPSTQGISNK